MGEIILVLCIVLFPAAVWLGIIRAAFPADFDAAFGLNQPSEPDRRWQAAARIERERDEMLRARRGPPPKA